LTLPSKIIDDESTVIAKQGINDSVRMHYRFQRLFHHDTADPTTVRKYRVGQTVSVTTAYVLISRNRNERRIVRAVATLPRRCCASRTSKYKTDIHKGLFTLPVE
jgi:hypothetical protein